MSGITFGQWPAEVHDEPDQKKRQKSALDKKLTPLSVDFNEESAVFKGTSKNQYFTTLAGCSCVDYGMRKKPCKHMYRLAMELGAFPGLENAETRDMTNLLSVDEVLSIISERSEDEQIRFGFICFACGKENRDAPVEAEGELIDWLVSKGLLCRDPSAANCLRYMRKDVILDLYADRCQIDKKMKKPEIIDEVCKVITYYDIPQQHRRGLVSLSLGISMDAIKIYNRIRKMYPEPEDE